MNNLHDLVSSSSNNNTDNSNNKYLCSTYEKKKNINIEFQDEL